MSILFNPDGTLDIATDPSDLAESGDGRNFSSGALTRAKNIDLVRLGRVKTRSGSSALGSAMTGILSHIEIVGADRYSFAGSTIYRNESSIATGLTNSTWSGIQYNAFNDTTDQIFALNGTDKKRIEASTAYQWGISAPTVAAVTSVGSAGSLTGAYSIKYSYVRKVGTAVVSESNPSPVSNTTTLSSEQLDFTFTASSDPQVTHVRIYRTVTGGTAWFYDQEIAVGTTSGTSSQADTALGDGAETDHDLPPAGTFVIGPNYNGTCFIIKDNLLYYCLAKRPEYWPSTYFIEVSTKQFPGTSLVFWNAQPYFFTKKDIYFIQGTGHPAFNPVNMKSRTGAQGPQGAFPVDKEGIYHVGSDGLYLFNGDDKKITEATLEPIFLGETVNDMPGATSLEKAWLIQFKNKLYFGYVGTGTYPDNVLVLFLGANRKVAYYHYPFEIVSVQIDHANNRLIAGCGDGQLRVLETGSDDSGTAIDWECQSKDFTLPTRAHFPRWAKYDLDVDSGTANGQIILDGAILQTHIITGSRNTTRRLIDSDNGNRCAIRLSGTGVSTVYLAEME